MTMTLSRFFTSVSLPALLLFFAISPALASAQTVVTPQMFGAIGNGIADDTNAIQLAIKHCPTRGTLNFGTGFVYAITKSLTLFPNRTYSGSSTLQLRSDATSGIPMMTLPSGQDTAVTITGLTFDANRIGGILQIAIGGDSTTPASNLTIQKCFFLNSISPAAPWQFAIYDPVGLTASTIANNTFTNCGAGINVANPNEVTISGNTFDTITNQDAIFIPINSGRDLTVSQNHGTNLSRMGIEIWGAAQGAVMNAPVVSGNVFRQWNPSSVPETAFGISVVVGSNAVIKDNVLSGGVAGFGIEVGSPGASVTGNTITDFPVGIVVQGISGSTISGNFLNNQTDSAIMLSNAGADYDTTVSYNYINNAQNYGIGSIQNDYHGSSFIGNTIVRAVGAFPNDLNPGAAFAGIKLDDGLSGPVNVINNTILQTDVHLPQVKLPSGKLGNDFQFWGLGVYGAYAGSVVTGNVIRSESTSPFGTGFNFWYQPYFNNSTVKNNVFSNLQQCSNGYMTNPSTCAN